ATGRVIRTLDGTKNPGINRTMWNLAVGQPGGGRGGGANQAVEPGTYVATLTVNGKTSTKSVTVLQDVWLRER
ncbi:MAG: hypothetical protein ABIX28_16465, partial [Vicinamibacterales bacterium]